ncbi:tetratricopeptide repeat protein [Frateuria hangzhouensis]|uniref:tetratricopeptide repeat protein n=1 Tax=Frateuria hangzhouensis TaxID=2995589 RepID=UPI002260B9E8|nr:tetratricopeptide repeat protein [Frateuria sp. STR12]MCX7513885.1 tetratricopeptide repeat protein [Frateuria sp. STR12]
MRTSVLSVKGKFKQLRHFAGAAGCAVGLAACASLPGGQATVPAPQQPLDRLTVVTPDAEHDLLAQLLAGEMALTRNDLKGASARYGHAMALSDDPAVAQRAAELALAVHDEAAARRAVARWDTLGASVADLAQARAELALATGDTEGARAQLQRLVHSGDPHAWRRFGRALIGARDPAQAGQLLETLATPERLPAEPQAWLAMSELGEKLGRPRYAQQVADAAVARFHDTETYAWAAQLKFKAGDKQGAASLLKQALARSPDNVHLRLTYASLLSQGGDYEAAARLLDKGPQSAETFALRAGLAAQAHDRKTLARLYRQLRQAPADVRESSAFLLGQLAEMQDHDGEALDWYDQVGDDDPHAFDADLRSAVILHTQGKVADAHALLEHLETAYLDQPEELRRAWQADAELYMREGDYAQAAKAYDHALQVLPDEPGLLYGRGLAYAEAGQIDQAVSDFRHLLRLKPNDVDASNALGYTLADAGRDLPEAKKLIEVARTAKPHDPAIADSWGWLQYRLGHLDEAARTLRQAWSAAKDADVGVHLGEVLWKLGKRSDAQHVFEQVRKLDPRNANLRDTLKRLEP